MAASQISQDGELDAQLANNLFDMEKWQQALMPNQQLCKGGLRQRGTVHLVLGMAHFNLGVIRGR